MVKICILHERYLQRGCTYERVPAGVFNGCVVCKKIDDVEKTVGIIEKRFMEYGLMKKPFSETKRKKLQRLLEDAIELKVEEHW